MIDQIVREGKKTHIEILPRENNHFIELREIGYEVIYPRAFCCLPVVFALFVYVKFGFFAFLSLRRLP